MLTNRSRSLIPLATVFIVGLCVFSTYGNAASSVDENVDAQSALAATTGPADPINIPGFPINIGGGGGNGNGGGGLRIWTPFGWITIGGGGDNHGGFHPFLPPLPPNPFLPPPSPPKPDDPLPQPSNPVTPSPSNPVTPSPSKPVTPNPSKPPPCKPIGPLPSNPVTPNPLKPTPASSTPPLPPWLTPFLPSPTKPSNPPSHPSNPAIPPWLAPYIGSDGRLHLPDRPSQPIPEWLAPFIGSPPHSSTPAHLKVNSMGTRSEASAVETIKTPAEERHHYYQCWSALEKTDKCVNEILTAFSSRKFQVLGSACCSAIQKMDKDCHARTIGNFHDHFFSASVHRHCSAN